MNAPEIIITLAGLGLAGLVLWYFFFAARSVASAASSAGGAWEVAITAKGGYSPAVIEMERGKPVQLRSYHDEENSCSEELLMPDFSIRRELPAFKTTRVELLPRQAGKFDFTCGWACCGGSWWRNKGS